MEKTNPIAYKIGLAIASCLGVFLGSFTLASALSTFATVQGGTGTTTPSGILYGDNGATNHLNTVTVGTGLTFTGGTLSSSGGSGTVGTSTNEIAGYLPYWTTTSVTPALLGKVATSSIGAGTGLTFSGTAGAQVGGVGGTYSVNTTQNITTLSNLSTAGLVSNTSGGVLYDSATTSATCSGTVSCTSFNVLGSSPITITGSGGAGSVSTSTNGVNGQITFFTANSATPEPIGGSNQLTWNNSISGLTLGTTTGNSNYTSTSTILEDSITHLGPTIVFTARPDKYLNSVAAGSGLPFFQVITATSSTNGAETFLTADNGASVDSLVTPTQAYTQLNSPDNNSFAQLSSLNNRASLDLFVASPQHETFLDPSQNSFIDTSGTFSLKTGAGTNFAFLDASGLSSTDKTFTFPNTSGTFCLTTTCANFAYPFNTLSEYGTTTAATTTMPWLKEGLYASTTNSVFQGLTIDSGVAQDAWIPFGVAGQYQWSIGINNTSKNFEIASSSVLGTNIAFTVASTTMFVGIATSTPNKALTVHGNGYIDGNLVLGTALTVANGGTGAATLTGCLTGNGTGAITGSGTCNTSNATVSSITAGDGLLGGTITTSGTLYGQVGTSSTPVSGGLPYWTSLGTATAPAKLGSVATTTLGGGTTGLTFSNSPVIIGSSASAVSGTLVVANGGTGLGSFTADSLLYSNHAGTALVFAATSTLSIGGNAATVTTNANLSGAVTSSGSNVTAFGTLAQGVLGNPASAATIPTAQATSTLYGPAFTVLTTNYFTGFGSSTPWGQVSINPLASLGSAPAFVIGSSSATMFAINSSGHIQSAATQPATSTAITLNWTNTPPQVEYQIFTAATTITLINATSAPQWGSRKLVWVCNPTNTAGALTWVGAEWIGTAPVQTTTGNQCDVYSFDVTRATSTSAYKVAGSAGTGFQ